MKLFGIAASTREGSMNRYLYDRISADINARGHEVETLDYTLFEDLPLYTDKRERAGAPEVVGSIASAIREADGVIIASPEYNFSMPASLKNGIDWLSRQKPHVFAGKPVMLMAASGSNAGGLRGLLAIRQSLLFVRAQTYPWDIVVGFASDPDRIDALLASDPLKTRVNAVLSEFLGNEG